MSPTGGCVPTRAIAHGDTDDGSADSDSDSNYDAHADTTAQGDLNPGRGTL